MTDIKPITRAPAQVVMPLELVETHNCPPTYDTGITHCGRYRVTFAGNDEFADGGSCWQAIRGHALIIGRAASKEGAIDMANAHNRTGILSAMTDAPAPDMTGPPITMTYTNYRGETSKRTIVPKSVFWGETEWHPEPQWLLDAHDLGKQAGRTFALKDCTFAPDAGFRAGIEAAAKWHDEKAAKIKRIIDDDSTLITQDLYGAIMAGHSADADALRALVPTAAPDVSVAEGALPLGKYCQECGMPTIDTRLCWECRTLAEKEPGDE